MNLELGDVIKWNSFPDKNPANQKTNWFVVLYACDNFPTLLRFTTQDKGGLLEIKTSVATCLTKNSFVWDRHVKELPMSLINRCINNITHFPKCVKGNEFRAILNAVQFRMSQDRYDGLKRIKNTIK